MQFKLCKIVSHFVSQTNMKAVLEMTRNFQLMFWDCYRRCEFQTRCSQVAVLSLSSPNSVDTRQVGRPKFDIKEETLDRIVELGIKLLVLIRIFNVEFCYNLATIYSCPMKNATPRSDYQTVNLFQNAHSVVPRKEDLSELPITYFEYFINHGQNKS